MEITKTKEASSVSYADQKLVDVSREFILKHGKLDFLDLCLGTINKILVEKKIVTKSELSEAYMADIVKINKIFKEKSKV